MTQPSTAWTCALGLLTALLCGCAIDGPRMERENFSTIPERALLVAIREVDANPEQRTAILAAYDAQAPRLRQLDQDSKSVLDEWQRLDRFEPGFLQKSADLAQRFSADTREQMTLNASFEQRVAQVLGADQWRQWQELWLYYNSAVRERGGGGGGGGR